jgi:hypothetical protein
MLERRWGGTDGHRLGDLTATAGNVSALQVLDRNMLNRGAASTGHPSASVSRACGWPVVYCSPVSVARNIQVLCEERPYSRCSSQVRSRTSGVRQTILGCIESAPFGSTTLAVSFSQRSSPTLASWARVAEGSIAATATTTVRALAAVRNPRFRHRDGVGIARLHPGPRRCSCHRHSQSWVPRQRPVGSEPDLQREPGREPLHYQ